MYKISIKGEAEIFFPSFDRAFGHLNRKYKVKQPMPYDIRELIEDGGTLSLDRDRIQFEKVSV